MKNKIKVHWIAWEKLSVIKQHGGLGFKDIQLFKQAFLAKQAYRLLQDPNCLFSLFLISRYFDNHHFLRAAIGDRPSFGWRSILFRRDLLTSELKQMVGNGHSLRVWTSQWLSDGRMRAPLMNNIFVNLELRVNDLIDPVTKSWNSETLSDLFFPRDIELIQKIKPVASSDDFWCWEHTKTGEYLVKSGYWLAYQIHTKIPDQGSNDATLSEWDKISKYGAPKLLPRLNLSFGK